LRGIFRLKRAYEAKNKSSGDLSLLLLIYVLHELSISAIHIEAPRVDCEKFSGNRLGESSETIRKRIQAAGDIQSQRFNGHHLQS
jgi:hypothetical protein